MNSLQIFETLFKELKWLEHYSLKREGPTKVLDHASLKISCYSDL